MTEITAAEWRRSAQTSEPFYQLIEQPEVFRAGFSHAARPGTPGGGCFIFVLVADWLGISERDCW